MGELERSLPTHIPVSIHSSAPEACFPTTRCIHELFEEQVRQTPGATAILFEGRATGYEELNIRANRLAHRLIALGVRPGALVAISLPRGPDLIVAILATLKAGGGYVPLDPAYPAERLAFMIEDSAPTALLTAMASPPQLGDLADRLPCLRLDDATDWEGESAENPDPAALGLSPSDLAYVIYTSGSTGTPKGVMVEHANVTRLFAATAHWFAFNSSDVWTLFHSYAFDFSVWEIWGALLHGGRLVIVPLEIARSPLAFYYLLCDEGVTVLNQTPSAFHQLSIAQGQTPRAHRLRVVIFGGEALDVSNLKRWYDRNGAAQTQLVNMYGITETTVHCTYRLLSPEDTLSSGPSPIGARIPDLRLYLLDADGKPTPVGVAGEIYVGGAGVSRGYLNRPELTAERFPLDPFIADATRRDARMYRSGDLGRWLPNGEMEFLGRNDNQVKIRGFRIELGEIEARLKEMAEVCDAVVVPREDQTGDRQLIAYLVAEADARLETLTLRQRLAARLPDYMIPFRFERVDAMPLTPNGKLDRDSLARRPLATAAPASAQAGETVESRLTGIMAELLEVAHIAPDDNFFDLGGHSLLALKLAARVEAEFRRRIPPAAVYDRPTPRLLAAFIKDFEIDDGWTPIVPLNECGPGQPLYCLLGFEGTAGFYLHFAHKLNHCIPVFGLRLNLASERNAPLSIEGVTDVFERAVRQAQPNGPYMFCGYSFGGVPAFELACRMERAGEKVTLILLDAQPQTISLKMLSWYPRFVKMVQARDILGTLKRKIVEFFRFELYYRIHGVDRDIEHDLKRSALKVKHAKFSGRVILFKSVGFDSERSYHLALDGYNGWTSYVESQIEKIEINAGHVGLMNDPSVADVTKLLKGALGTG